MGPCGSSAKVMELSSSANAGKSRLMSFAMLRCMVLLILPMLFSRVKEMSLCRSYTRIGAEMVKEWE